MSNNGTGCRIRDLTSNVQLRNSLLDDRTWWCQRVDHEFEFGNHLDYIPITSTYQVKLSVTDVQNHSACPGILNSLAVGDLVAVELPITTRRADEMISLQVGGSENCTAFMVQPPTNPSSESSNKDSKITYVDAIVPVGQICSITLLENRIWKREFFVVGKESIKQHIPANEALLTSASVISAKKTIAIHDFREQSRVKCSTGVATIECSYDLNRVDALEFKIVLLARLRTGILLFNGLVPIVALGLYVAALVEYTINGGASPVVVLVIFATLMAVLNRVWASIRQNYFENSLFRVGKP